MIRLTDRYRVLDPYEWRTGTGCVCVCVCDFFCVCRACVRVISVSSGCACVRAPCVRACVCVCHARACAFCFHVFVCACVRAYLFALLFQMGFGCVLQAVRYTRRLWSHRGGYSYSSQNAQLREEVVSHRYSFGGVCEAHYRHGHIKVKRH